MSRLPLILVLGFGSAWAAPQTSSSKDAIEIIGDRQTPEVVVTMSRINLNKAYELELEESFLHRIVESLAATPF